MRIAVFGLGEAGSLIAADLATAGVDVHAYDPEDVLTPPSVIRHDEPAPAVAGAELVMAITAARDAQAAIAQAWDAIRRGTIYADLSTAPASLKLDLCDTATLRGLPFVDVALMATVPGKGVATPSLASGPGAAAYAELLGPLGAVVEVVSEEPGAAATRKLLRSVFVKGMTGVLTEALRAGQAAGDLDWIWRHLADVIDDADEAFLRRLLSGTTIHAERREEEMRHAATLLTQLGVDPIMTRATMESLALAAAEGVPEPKP